MSHKWSKVEGRVCFSSVRFRVWGESSVVEVRNELRGGELEANLLISFESNRLGASGIIVSISLVLWKSNHLA